MGEQFDNLAASVCFDSGEPSADLLEFDTSKDVDGLGGISLRLGTFINHLDTIFIKYDLTNFGI